MLVLLPSAFAFDHELLASHNNSHPRGAEIEYRTYPSDSSSFAGFEGADMLVLASNTQENAEASVRDLPNIKLVQTLAAGPDHLYGLGYNERITLASGRGLHDITVTEHALALTLSVVRDLERLHQSQILHTWNHEYVSAQASRETESLYTLNKAKVLIYGFGSIAANLAPILSKLGASVTGVAQSSGERHGFQVVAASNAQKEIAEADIVISLLPYTQASDKFFNAQFFNQLKKSAIFINVGRGKTVDESALIKALTSGALRRAAIDVTSVEPLPADSELWATPNLTITPHIAGGRPRNSEELIAFNAHALLTGSEIRNIVARP